MLYQIKRSDRPTVHYSPIANVQEAVKELYRDTTGVKMLVSNMKGLDLTFDSSCRMSKREIREQLLRLQELV